jgi:hypothetical protein
MVLSLGGCVVVLDSGVCGYSSTYEGTRKGFGHIGVGTSSRFFPALSDARLRVSVVPHRRRPRRLVRPSFALAAGPGFGVVPAPVVLYEEGQLGGRTAYQAMLAKGALQAGTHTVTASAGADVGQFQATAQMGADIQLQTPLAGTHVWAGGAALVIQWAGGDPSSWVPIKGRVVRW